MLASEMALASLRPAPFRRLTGVLRVIETKAMARNPARIGPLSECCGCLLLLHAIKPVVTPANRPGLCKSYATLTKGRRLVAADRRKAPLVDFLDISRLIQIVWDIIDTRKGLTTSRRDGKIDGFHGSLLVAIVSRILRGIHTNERPTPMTIRNVPALSALINHPRVGDPGRSTRSAKLLIAGL